MHTYIHSGTQLILTPILKNNNNKTQHLDTVSLQRNFQLLIWKPVFWMWDSNSI